MLLYKVLCNWLLWTKLYECIHPKPLLYYPTEYQLFLLPMNSLVEMVHHAYSVPWLFMSNWYSFCVCFFLCHFHQESLQFAFLSFMIFNYLFWSLLVTNKKPQNLVSCYNTKLIHILQLYTALDFCFISVYFRTECICNFLKIRY